MEKTINGVKYYLPSNLNLEQTDIYIHIIDWKRKNIGNVKTSPRKEGYTRGMNTMLLFLLKTLSRQ